MGFLWKLIGEEAVRYCRNIASCPPVCVSLNCLHASAIGLPTSCSRENSCQNLSPGGVTQANFPPLSECSVDIFDDATSVHFSLLMVLLLHCALNCNMPLSEPCMTYYCLRMLPWGSCKVRHRWHICRFSSPVLPERISRLVSPFIHSLHHGSLNSFSCPFKGRVNPPSIWHAVHLAERHGGWLGDREGREEVVVVVGGVSLWEVSSWADGPLSGVVSGVFTWRRRLQDLTGPGLGIQVATAPPDQLEERWDHLTLAGRWYTFLCCFVLLMPRHKSPETIKEFS